MPSYTVHIPKGVTTAEATAEKAVFVKDGFVFAGFVFTGLWLLANRLWFHAVGYGVALGIIAGALYLFSLPFAAFGPAQLLLALLIGLEGQEWRRWRLARTGHTHAGTVTAASLDECERRFFEQWLAEQPALQQLRGPSVATETPVLSPAPPQVLGSFPTPRWQG